MNLFFEVSSELILITIGLMISYLMLKPKFQKVKGKLKKQKIINQNKLILISKIK